MTAFTKDDFPAVGKMLHKIRTDKQAKLRYGAQKRLELKTEQKKGIKSDHYRMEWLKQSRDEMVRWLSAKAVAFNVEHPHDACSVQDLIDVTVATMMALKAYNDAKD